MAAMHVATLPLPTAPVTHRSSVVSASATGIVTPLRSPAVIREAMTRITQRAFMASAAPIDQPPNHSPAV
jgi:hypothetical protein